MLRRNYTWPVMEQVITEPSVPVYGYRTVDGAHKLLDCFTDVGAAPMPAPILNGWVTDAIRDGWELRKPQAYWDEMRDRTLPLAIGQQLGLGDDVSVFYSHSGSEAVEAAIKLVRKATGRTRVLGIAGDFHGKTYGAASLHSDGAGGGEPPYHFEGFGPFVPDVFAVQPTDSIGIGANAAALVISPVNGNNTLEDWPAWVWALARDVRRGGGLIVFDEVQTGWGRGGGVVSITETEWYQTNIGIPYGLERPDVWVFGKAAAAGLPLSITVTTEPIAAAMTSGTHFLTMAGSPLTCAVSYRMLHWLRNGGVEHMVELAEHIEGLWPEDIIRRGYMMGIRTDDAPALVARAREVGLLMMTARQHGPVRISPAFLLSGEEEQFLVHGLTQLLGEPGEVDAGTLP